MPRIVHILPGKANPDRLNGVNKVVFSVASESIRRGYDTEVWGLTATPDDPAQAPFPLQLFRSYRRPFKVDPAITAAINTQPQDTVFHFHGVLIPAYSMLIRELVRMGRPYVMTPHGALMPPSLRHGAWYKRPYIALFEQFNLRHAATVHVITRDERTAVTDLCATAKTALIPNGTDPVEILPESPRHADPVFLYMGRFAKKHKGLDCLLKAFARFYQKNQRGRLIIAGGGPDQNWLRTFIRDQNLNGCVDILPPQFGDDRGALLAQANIFVHASRWDVMPTGCLEAAAHGKPLLVTRQTGLSDYVTPAHAGWIVPSSEPSVWEHAFNIVLRDWDNGEVGTMGQNAARMIQDKLSWQDIVPSFYTNLYTVQGIA